TDSRNTAYDAIGRPLRANAETPPPIRTHPRRSLDVRVRPQWRGPSALLPLRVAAKVRDRPRRKASGEGSPSKGRSEPPSLDHSGRPAHCGARAHGTRLRTGSKTLLAIEPRLPGLKRVAALVPIQV